jgi:chemotaxis protein CheY-P-specific phosphatase CheC
MSSLGGMTGLDLELCPPQLVTDLLSSIVASVLAAAAADTDTALVLDTALDLPAHPCSLKFLLVPIGGSSVNTLLEPLGL